MSTKRKFRSGHQVVFKITGDDNAMVGKVEAFLTHRKSVRYYVRGENGKLYPPLAIDKNVGPGLILSKPTEALFGKKNENAPEVEEEEIG